MDTEAGQRRARDNTVRVYLCGVMVFLGLATAMHSQSYNNPYHWISTIGFFIAATISMNKAVALDQECGMAMLTIAPIFVIVNIMIALIV
jgi:hypothetical protein